MARDRFAPREASEAADRVRRDLASPVRAFGPVLEVLCPVAGAAVAVFHQLGRRPDGYHVLLLLGGQVSAIAMTAWNESTAYLVADTDNTRVRVMFVAVQEVQNG
jgi:hypothetical protein